MKTNNFFVYILYYVHSLFFFTNEIDKELSSPFYSKDGKFEIDNQDTISARFPFLADILDFYYVYYLAMPDNLDELEEFIDSMHVAYPEELYYYDILKKTNSCNSERKKIKHIYFLEKMSVNFNCGCKKRIVLYYCIMGVRSVVIWIVSTSGGEICNNKSVS